MSWSLTPTNSITPTHSKGANGMNIWKKVTIAASVAGLIVAAWLAWGAGATVAEAAGAHCKGAPNCSDVPRVAASGRCLGSECYWMDESCCRP